MPAALMNHVVNPRKVITDKIGDLSNIDLFYNKILVGIYIRPEKTAGGIIYTDETREEDRFQGKAGLVLKIGPTAFKDEGSVQFYGQKVQVGDWIVFRPSNGLKMKINSIDCVYLQDVHVEMRVDRPDWVY